MKFLFTWSLARALLYNIVYNMLLIFIVNNGFVIRENKTI